MNASDRKKSKARLTNELEDLRILLAEAVKLNFGLKREAEALRESESHYRLLAENVTDVVWNADMNLEVTYVSPSVKRLIGYTVEEVMTKPLEELLPPASLQTVMVIFEEEIIEEKEEQKDNFRVRTFEVEVITKEGSTIWTEVKASFLRDDNGQPVGIWGSARDITERRKAEDALRESESHYRLLAENVTDVVWTFDLNLRATYVSPSVKRMIGYTVEKVITKPLEELLTPASLQTVMKIFEEGMSREKEGQTDQFRVRTFEVEVKTKEGSTIWTEVKASFLRDDNGQPVGIWGSTRDITERKRYEEKIKQQVLYDQLTNLATRKLFFENLIRVIYRAKRFKHYVFVFYIDLDGFKSVNDEFGHKYGDCVLIEVAKRIKNCVRKIDTAARLGGDEFAIILSDIRDREHKGYIEDVANRIVRSISYPITINGNTCNIGASIGISIYPDDGRDADTLIQKADKAMYVVKKTVRNNYQFSGISK